MTETYKSLEPAGSETIEYKAGDTLHDILVNKLSSNVMYGVVEKIDKAVAEYPDEFEVVRFMGNDPVSDVATRAILNTAWGIRLIQSIKGTPLENALETLNQSPDITYEVAENVAQEITTRTINFSVEYQEEIQQACEAASNMG